MRACRHGMRMLESDHWLASAASAILVLASTLVLARGNAK
jgi:hypothetical protein